MSNPFQTIRSVIISLTIFLFPLFFLPITTEFYQTNKLYLLLGSAVLLIVTSLVELIIAGKTELSLKPFDLPALLFLAAVGISTLVVSPNKAASLTTPALSVLSVAAVIIFYFYLSREKHEKNINTYVSILQYSVAFLCVIELIVFGLSQSSGVVSESLKFFSSARFTTLGMQTDLLAFLGFFVVYLGIRVYIAVSNKEFSWGEMLILLLVLGSLAVGAVIYLQTAPTDLPYAPLSYSVKAASLIFKNPLHMLFGFGPDNFSVAFTQAKDAAYASSPLAAIPSFSLSRSMLLHILTESGIFGLFAICLIFLRGIYEAVALPNEVKTATISLFIYVFMIFIMFPPSLTLLFILFVTLGLLHHDIIANSHRHTHRKTLRQAGIHPLFSGMMAVVIFGLLGWGAYTLLLYYQADMSFRQSIQSINNHNLTEAYTGQYNAVLLNPYNERYRASFSQTNIYIANQIAANAKNSNSSLSQKDQDTVQNAIKTAIAEGKAVITLNPDKASNWENLGLVYKNLLGAADKADEFAIAAYQRAISLDPYNPFYKNSLGEIYYLTKQYNQARTLFQQAVELNPKYTNGYYNLAWTYFGMGDRDHAIAAMQKVTQILSEKPESSDFKKAQSDIERFKNTK